MLLLAGSAAALMRAPVLRRSAAPAVAMSRIHATTTLPGPAAAVAPEDEWTQKMDYPAFQKEVAELGDRLEKNQGPEDVAHLRKMCRWSNICGGFGMLTMWSTSPVLRPLSVFALSLWTMSRWTMIAHHTCHGGYNRQDDGSGRFTSKGFALGSTYVRARDCAHPARSHWRARPTPTGLSAACIHANRHNMATPRCPHRSTISVCPKRPLTTWCSLAMPPPCRRVRLDAPRGVER